MCDLLWSDPDMLAKTWKPNDRGISVVFGEDIVEKFLKDNDLDLICRAHEVQFDGYEFFARRKLVTVFSAPNYCGEFDNDAAIMSIDESLCCRFQCFKPVSRTDRRIESFKKPVFNVAENEDEPELSDHPTLEINRNLKYVDNNPFA